MNMACILVLGFLLNLAWVWSAPVIDAPWGRMSGIDGTIPGGAPYSAYLDIPYAAAPVGELRFAKPIARQGPGQGRVFNASSLGYICPQYNTALKDIMNEDCLTLNVYVPATATGPKSVMIRIHGGGFTVGSAAEYTPSELITETNVIVVVIQYRLDILGFLSSGNGVVSGNFGLMDKNLAIRCVKDNIQAFGGDPNSVTLFGQSAGAASVGLQLLTPISKDLNIKAILQSGTLLAFWALNRNPSKSFHRMANFTGCLNAASWFQSVYNWMSADEQRVESERILPCLMRQDLWNLIPNIFLMMQDGKLELESPWDISDTYTDIFMTVPTVRFIRDLAAATEKTSSLTPAGRLYMYLFNHYPASRTTEELKGMYHGDGINYEFDPKEPLFTREGFNTDVFSLASAFKSMLTNFAKSG